MNGEPIIRTTGLSRKFVMGAHDVIALDDVSVEVRRGEFLALAGPSGSGKSTLLYILGALEEPSSGDVTVDGRSLTRLSEKEKARYRRSEVSFVFQDFNLMGHLTALENVAMPLIYTETPRSKRRDLAASALEKVGLVKRVTHKPGELSGGERQRVAIARALVTGPKILLADEPTGNLDSTTGEEVIGLISDLNRDAGITTIMVTHNEQISEKAHRKLRMMDGRVLEDAS